MPWKNCEAKINIFLHMQTECSCIIINCNRTRIFAIANIHADSWMERGGRGEGLKCHCKSIKTDDLFRCLIRCWCCWSVVPAPYCPHGVIFLLLHTRTHTHTYTCAICLATIFIKMHEIAMPIQIVAQCTHIFKCRYTDWQCQSALSALQRQGAHVVWVM